MKQATVTVQRQREIGSQQWGVYINRRLVEGGFFARANAERVADAYRANVKEAK